MGLLQKAEKSLAYGKVGIFGFQGAGKSFTAWLIALGISKLIGNPKIAWFDTETGSDFFIDWAEKEKIELYQVKKRSFVDILGTISECEESKIGVLIEDSVTHIWRDLCESYDKKLNRKGRLQFQDWAIIKGEWKKYTDAFINSKLHVLALGRAGFEYDYDMNPDGTKDLIKTGTKFKAESEFGFEPHLVIEMERVTPGQEQLRAIKEIKDERKRKEQKQLMRPSVGSQWIHRAHILKDRTDMIDGMAFDDPIFENFMPHFQRLNLGGKHLGVDTTKDSTELFTHDGKPIWKYEQEQKEIIQAEIKATFDKYFPSSSAAEKKAKIDLAEHVFGVRSKEAVDSLDLSTLRIGKEYLDWLLLKEWIIDALIKQKDVATSLKNAQEEWYQMNAEEPKETIIQ